MSYQVLARKYRPQGFAEVIGQEHVTRTLTHALEQERIAHGYIFSGHRGIGKTTVARILAMALNCRAGDRPRPEPCGTCDSCVEIREGRSVDVLEIDAATNRGIDEIRELREAARYRPARDRFKIWILDEAHQITDAAFNALLKTLEEPPAHVVFMLATTQPEDIPQTIRSRCQHFSFHAVRFEEIVGQLKAIALKEKIQADDEALAMLAEAGDGSMRDALSILDQAIAGFGEKLTAAAVRGLVGAVPSETLEEMMDAVQRNSSEEVLRLVDRLLSEGQNPAYFARQMARFLRNAIMAKVAGRESPLLQISSDERARAARVAEKFSEEDLTRFLQILLRTHNELGYKQEQRFHLELGLLKLVHAQRLLPVEEILSGAESNRVAQPPSPGVASSRMASPPAVPARPAAKGPSPFEADKARKSGLPKPEMSVGATALATAEAPAAAAEPGVLELRSVVLAALEDAGHRMLATMLERGQWSLQGVEVAVQVKESEGVVEMAMGAEPRRIANAAAAKAAGRPVKLKVVGGAATSGSNGDTGRAPAPAGGVNGRTRATQDPVVRRMQDKFGAEIRTVIDHKDKR
ncbi:MAG TPA: DNA polymerase III subunit gamma/tau [Terriglobales bacterium]|jgi:DNA polymerase-3 subunit gamma/tau|nr:DNA polymerase III subunit gamma/tau [Terriglobales bacterium]